MCGWRVADDALFADDAAFADDDGPVVGVDAGAWVDDGPRANGDGMYTLAEDGVRDGGGLVGGDGSSGGGRGRCGG